MADVKTGNWFSRTWGAIRRYFRELRSELKKVVWSTPQQVLKNTLIVLACVLVVGVFIWLFDFVARIGIDALINGVKGLFSSRKNLQILPQVLLNQFSFLTSAIGAASLLGLVVDSVLSAESAVLLHFETVRVVLLVLHGVVVSLLALGASQSDFNAHNGTSLNLPPCITSAIEKFSKRSTTTL